MPEIKAANTVLVYLSSLGKKGLGNKENSRVWHMAALPIYLEYHHAVLSNFKAQKALKKEKTLLKRCHPTIDVCIANKPN